MASKKEIIISNGDLIYDENQVCYYVLDAFSDSWFLTTIRCGYWATAKITLSRYDTFKRIKNGKYFLQKRKLNDS